MPELSIRITALRPVEPTDHFVRRRRTYRRYEQAAGHSCATQCAMAIMGMPPPPPLQSLCSVRRKLQFEMRSRNAVSSRFAPCSVVLARRSSMAKNAACRDLLRGSLRAVPEQGSIPNRPQPSYEDRDQLLIPASSHQELPIGQYCADRILPRNPPYDTENCWRSQYHVAPETLVIDLSPASATRHWIPPLSQGLIVIAAPSLSKISSISRSDMRSKTLASCACVDSRR